MTVQDQGAMNVEPEMSVQLKLCCHHSTMYVQQFLGAGYNSLKHL